MKKNVLPGEDGPSDWFDRLNEFEQEETARQVAFKRRHTRLYWQRLAAAHIDLLAFSHLTGCPFVSGGLKV